MTWQEFVGPVLLCGAVLLVIAIVRHVWRRKPSSPAPLNLDEYRERRELNEKLAAIARRRMRGEL